jgi:hypothetical protein
MVELSTPPVTADMRRRQLICSYQTGKDELMTNMIVYLIGTLLVVAGLAYGASRFGVSQVWIISGALVIIGLGLMAGIVKTRQKDPAS